jgi:arabinofuranosyltransferase
MRSRRLLLALSLAFVTVVVLRAAWVSDDAYRVLRAVEHAIDGHGLRWNVSERVHIFEEPLWMLLLLAARAVVDDAYAAAVGLSMICSISTALIVLRGSRTDAGIVIGTAILSLSVAFVTWSSSGTGDPLAHVLVAAFAARWLLTIHTADHGDSGRTDWMLWLLAGLAALTRVETLAITALPLVQEVRAYGIRASRARLVLLVAPLAAWAVVATWYFGSPVPVPAIARHNDSVAWGEQLRLGSAFVADALRRDPLTPAVVAFALLITAGRPSRARALSVGGAAYVALLAVEGGSADGERLLGAALVAATIAILARVDFARPAVAAATLSGVVALGATSATTTLAADASFGSSAFDTRRVHDARAADYQATGLLRWSRVSRPPRHPEAARGLTARSSSARVGSSDRPGFFGFAAGPGVHVIDAHGGGDPLLARLPPAVGTFGYGPRLRRLPDGYTSSIERGTNVLAEPSLAALNMHVRRVSRSPLSDLRRLSTAWRLASGSFDMLIRESSYGTRTVPLQAIQAEGSHQPSTSPGAERVLEGGLRVELGRLEPVRRVELVVTDRNDVTVDLVDGASLVARLTSRANAVTRPGLAPRYLVAPRTETASALVIRCGRGSNDCRVGYVRVAR